MAGAGIHGIATAVLAVCESLACVDILSLTHAVLRSQPLRLDIKVCVPTDLAGVLLSAFDPPWEHEQLCLRFQFGLVPILELRTIPRGSTGGKAHFWSKSSDLLGPNSRHLP